MRLAFAAALAATSLPLAAQSATAIFVGRFNFTSLDAPNERSGGSLTQLSGFDLSAVTPGSGAVARTWLPTTGLAAEWGDPIGDGNYTKFQSYFPNDWDWCGPFVRYANRGANNPPVFWTVRDQRVPSVNFKVFDGANTTAVHGGDFFRFAHNGTVEFFVRQTQIAKASGTDPMGRPESEGADCLVQDAQRNLYWSPVEAGDWVLGNDPANPVYASRAAIVMLDAADITYDARGNVADVRADSAHVIFGGFGASGPNGQPSIHDFVANSGAVDYAGTPIAPSASGYYNTVGLALDPAGGTTTASIPRTVGSNTVFDVVPHLLFHSDNGTHAGTVFSTRNNPNLGTPGSIAVINGVMFGSDLAGVPATGAWWGVQQNTSAFEPTLMGFALIDTPPALPMSADAPNHGAILATDPTIDIDFHSTVPSPIFYFLSAGPLSAGAFQFSVDARAVAGAWTFSHLYATASPSLFLGLGNTNPSGYQHLAIANPSVPAIVGVSVEFQGVRLRAGKAELSNPVQCQFK